MKNSQYWCCQSRPFSCLRQQKSRTRFRFHFYRQRNFMPAQKCVSFLSSSGYVCRSPACQRFSHLSSLMGQVQKKFQTIAAQVAAAVKHSSLSWHLCLPTEAQIQGIFQYFTYTRHVFITSTTVSDTKMEKKEEPEFRCVL